MARQDLTFEEAKELINLSAFRPIPTSCMLCGASPVVQATDMCGPCTFGEADTVNGGWWDEDNQKRLDELLAKRNA